MNALEDINLIKLNLHDITLLMRTFNEFGLYQSGNTLANEFAERLIEYSKTNWSLIKLYFNDEVSLTQLCHEFIKTCQNHKELIAPQDILACWDYHNVITNQSILNAIEPLCLEKKDVNIFSYGIGNGEYELSLKSFLEEKYSINVGVYGYDPYPDIKSNSICYVTPEESEQTSYDIIIARWVLHHVEDNCRWSEFSSFLRCLSQHGKAIIIEHGYTETPPETLHEKFLAFLNATYDVITNYHLRPSGFINHNQTNHSFYISYLNMDDIARIGSGYNVTVTTLGPKFPQQTEVVITR
ncbi:MULTISPECIES: hypothetical protein [Cysteiniphilum]|uniref:hypothetical protein n=1 Tax=Cysteiniphilum TaxID=2056696 RepID=UPI001782D944|nr:MULTISPECIES: hypothetical protein [Cysteiniphilum]